MKREFVSGNLMWKSELKERVVKGENVYVIDYGIRENDVIKTITAWGKNAERVNEIPKGDIILSSCSKKAFEKSTTHMGADGKEYKDVEERYTCERLVTDPEYIKEIFAQHDKMMRDFNAGKISSIYISEDVSLYKGENAKDEIESEKDKVLEEDIER